MEMRGWCQTRRGHFRSGVGSSSLAAARRLPVTIEYQIDRIVVKACLPNVRPEDIALKISGRQLTIATSRMAGGRSRGRAAVTTGQSWYRRIRLPGPIRPDQSTVRLEGDELTVVLPRAATGFSSLSQLPGGQVFTRSEITLTSAAEIMPPSSGPHITVYRP
jgi:HSP20 family molecular chaperone IbpA